nr:RecName: Full=Calotropin-DI [Calotropis gigantea]
QRPEYPVWREKGAV